jgi:hypothetical protein
MLVQLVNNIHFDYVRNASIQLQYSTDHLSNCIASSLAEHIHVTMMRQVRAATLGQQQMAQANVPRLPVRATRSALVCKKSRAGVATTASVSTGNFTSVVVV